MQGAREALNAVAKVHTATVKALSPLQPPVAGTDRARAALSLLGPVQAGPRRRARQRRSSAPAGLTFAGGGLAATADGAVALAERVGYPVVAKIESADNRPQVRRPAVCCWISDRPRRSGGLRDDLERGAALGARIDGVRIEQQAPDALLHFSASSSIPRSGPAVVLGQRNLTPKSRRRRVLLAPTTARDVRRVASASREQTVTVPGPNRQPDIGALVEAVVALSEFAWAAREESPPSMWNPVIVHPAGGGVTGRGLRCCCAELEHPTTAEPRYGKETHDDHNR